MTDEELNAKIDEITKLNIEFTNEINKLKMENFIIIQKYELLIKEIDKLKSK